MAIWLVHTGRKDLIEKQEFTKGDSEIIYSLGWRTGTWEVTTSDENEPDFESDEEGMVEFSSTQGSNIEECEFIETIGGWYDNWDFSDDVSEEEQKRIQEGWEEDSYTFMSGEGWLQGDTYWYAKKELLIIEKKDS